MYVSGEPGNPTSLDRSLDSGATWTAPVQGFPPEVYSMADLDFLSPSFGYVALSTSGPGLYLTEDGGAVWQPVTIP